MPRGAAATSAVVKELEGLEQPVGQLDAGPPAAVRKSVCSPVSEAVFARVDDETNERLGERPGYPQSKGPERIEVGALLSKHRAAAVDQPHHRRVVHAYLPDTGAGPKALQSPRPLAGAASGRSPLAEWAVRSRPGDHLSGHPTSTANATAPRGGHAMHRPPRATTQAARAAL